MIRVQQRVIIVQWKHCHKIHKESRVNLSFGKDHSCMKKYHHNINTQKLHHTKPKSKTSSNKHIVTHDRDTKKVKFQK